MRQGVTFQDVESAAFSLLSQGSNPTIDRIRSFLGGRGSNTTISKYLNQWRQQQSNLDEKIISAPPDPVQAAVKRVWQELQQETQSEIEKIKAESEEKITAAISEKEQLSATYTALETDYQDLKSVHQRLSAEKELLLLDIKELREQQTLLIEKNTALDIRHRELQTFSATHLNELKISHEQAVSDLQKAHQDQQKQNQNYISDMKEKHEAERQRHILQIDSLQVSNQKKENELREAKEITKELKIKNTELSQKISALTSEKTILTEHLTQQEKQFKKILEQLVAQQKTLDTLQILPTLAKQLTAMEKNLNEGLHHQFKTIHHKIADLHLLREVKDESAN